MKYYRVKKIRYRIHKDGRLEVKSGYSNVWMLPQFYSQAKAEVELIGLPTDEYGNRLCS